MRRVLVRSVLVGFALVASSSAPQGTAVLEGRVFERDADGRPHPVGFANVVLIGPRRGMVCDEDGRFRVVAVPAGEHRVRVMQAGFRPLDTLLTFGAHATTRLDAELLPAPPRDERTMTPADLPSKALRRRLAAAPVVRAFRLEHIADGPRDTLYALGGERMGAPLVRDGAWAKRLRAALGRRESWSSVGPAAVNMSVLYGLRLHDARGWLDVVVVPRSGWLSVSENGGPARGYAWNVNRGSLGSLFE
ncbi:MAG: carboxypeptidase-like regulatory domain-containing protein [Candidatus Eisenbacteria bacterium]